jgi:hypothetical protein
MGLLSADAAERVSRGAGGSVSELPIWLTGDGRQWRLAVHCPQVGAPSEIGACVGCLFYRGLTPAGPHVGRRIRCGLSQRSAPARATA